MASALEGLAKHAELRKRILFSLGMLAVYRLGVHVPTPGVDSSAVSSLFKAHNAGIFGLFNTFSGGALERFSIFALGIMPYISSSIIFQLLTAVLPHLEQLKKEGEAGRRKINQYTRYGTVLLAIVQGWGISTWLLKQPSPDGQSLVLGSYIGVLPFRLMTILTLTAGTCFIMWLGEQITERGIGNGASLIIFCGIAAGIPTGAISLYELVKADELSGFLSLSLIAFMILVVGVIVFLEVGQRRIPIQYSVRGVGRQAVSQPTNHLPLRLNSSGVIPPIFASSLLLFPATMTQFINVPWLAGLGEYISPTGALYNVIFVGLIVFFCFFYTEIVLNPNEVAENLKKVGGFIPGIRAGKSTSEYVKKIIDRINVGGAIYLSGICILPGILMEKMKVPFYFGGTSLLILVGVAKDTFEQIQSYLLSQKYEGFIKGTKVRARRVRY